VAYARTTTTTVNWRMMDGCEEEIIRRRAPLFVWSLEPKRPEMCCCPPRHNFLGTTAVLSRWYSYWSRMFSQLSFLHSFPKPQGSFSLPTPASSSPTTLPCPRPTPKAKPSSSRSNAMQPPSSKPPRAARIGKSIGHFFQAPSTPLPRVNSARCTLAPSSPLPSLSSPPAQ